MGDLPPPRRRKNPSSIVYWNDLRNDPKLRRCSPAAKGLWCVHMLPAAAESVEYGVVLIDGEESLQHQLGDLFCRELGETEEVTQVLVDELVRKGAAELDDKGRVFCRRMVREEKARQQRSNAGKLGAAAKHAKRTLDETHGGSPDGEHGEMPGELEGDISGLSHGAERETAGGARNGGWRDGGEHHGEPHGEPMASSRPSRPSRPSLDEEDTGINGVETTRAAGAACDDAPALALQDGGGRGPEQAVFDAWNGAADRVGRWPKAKKLDADRRKLIRARVKSAGGASQVLAVIGQAEASQFVRESMRGFSLDWLLKATNFRKIAEGNFADDKQPRSLARGGAQQPQPAGRMAALKAVKDRYRSNNGGAS